MFLLAVEPTIVIGGASVFSLVGIAATLLIRLVRVVPEAYIEQIDRLGKVVSAQQDDIARLTSSHWRCERRCDRLIEAMRAAGLTIPEEVWTNASEQ